MGNTAILQFVLGLVKVWDRRRAACLGRLVVALMRGGRLGVAALGRFRPTSTTDKHHIKAVDRFLGNAKVELSSLFEALVNLAAGGRGRLFVLLDWTDLHDGMHETLCASVPFAGRAVPVAWATSKKGSYLRSRNALEVALCKLLRGLLRRDVELVVVADRGFGRASFFRSLRRAKIRFLVRIRRDVHLIDARGHGPAANRSIARGRTRDLPAVEYGDDARVGVRCVITFAEGTSKKRPKQPWYLVTDLAPEELPAHLVVAAYKLRMRIEQGFRDQKSLRFGFQLRAVRLTRAERYDKLLAVAAVAMLLLMLIGIAVERAGLDRGYRANTVTHRTHSLLHLGQAWLYRLRVRPGPRLLVRALEDGDLRG